MRKQRDRLLLGLVFFIAFALPLYAYHTVSRQTHGIAIRMALGASRKDVMGMVLRMGLWLIIVGLSIGVGASLSVNKVIASELWGVSPRDPVTFVGVGLVVLAAGVTACWFPALRATRVDPLVALRFE